jgi:hypothetical protein
VERGSVCVLGERRIGKTWFLQFARGRCPGKTPTVFYDAEADDSAKAFAVSLCRQIGIELGSWGKVKGFARRLLFRVQGQDLGKVKLPEFTTWQEYLEWGCKRLAGLDDIRCGVVFIDELPFLLQKLVQRARPQEAADVLDTLRRLRHAFPKLRLVLCGSLGFHVVLRQLEETIGYSGSPLNDTVPFEVPPLDRPAASGLAALVLKGEAVSCENTEEAAEKVAALGDGVPFYIKHLIRYMKTKSRAGAWNAADIDVAASELLTDAADPADLAYYEKRLRLYYPEDVVDKAFSVLDALSKEPNGMPLDQIVNLVRHRPKTQTADASQVRDVVEMLERDHYLLREDARFTFKLGLVRRWWWENRGRNGL